MADNGHSGAVDDDLSLPRATVAKLISEFIHLVSSQANEICDKESRKTISPEHIMTALEQLEFNHFIPEIKEVFEEHRTQAKQEREKRVSKFEESGLTEEELYEQQQALFAKSRAAFDAQGTSGAGPSMS